jgi:murein DD-endopeptidase MepM/ murein hydrolase activator NlpD
MAENQKKRIIDILIDGGAAVINWHDRTQARADRLCIRAYYQFALFVHNKRDRVHELKPKILQYFAGILLATIAVLAIYNYALAYEYSYHGRVLGYVKNQDDVIKVLNLSNDELSKARNVKINIVPGEDITFKRVVSLHNNIDSDDTVLKRLTYLSNMRADAYGIYLNGKYYISVADKAQAKNVISDVKAYYAKSDAKKKTVFEQIKVAEKIGYQPHSEKLTSVYSENSAVDKIIKEKAITVKTVEKSTFAEVIKYKTVIKKTSSMYKGDSKVVQKGKNGKRAVTARITKVNGKQINRVDLHVKTLKSMTKKVIYKGTKTRPKTAPTGSFIMPVSGYTLSSTFGYRWGRMHEGVDLACATGTPIHASDGGTVVRAGWYMGYGKCVDISHGNGYVTRYGHCSKILVHTGQKVYQGQTIALVGNTGNSYGSHCHFEVRVNGSARNPLKYVK